MTKKSRKVTTTVMQRAGVDNILSGNYKSKKDALVAAGFKEKSDAKKPGRFLKRPGVQKYLNNFEAKALAKFGITLDSKLQDVYLDGLTAEKPSKLLGVMPDYKIRKEYADTIQEMKGRLESSRKSSAQQFNFFVLNKDERNDLGEKLEDFIRGQFSPSSA